jgi:CheY-like chemotaxis protein
MNTTRGLIVDNNCDMANFMEIVLGLAGVECETAISPEAALDYLATNKPDLIFLDHNLKSSAEVSDLIYRIRSNPRFDKTRLVVITGHPALAQPVQSLADLVLANPVVSEHLTRLTSRLMMMEIKPYEFRDPRTGLYSLKFFHTRLELALARARRRPEFLFSVQAIELLAGDEGLALSDQEWEQAVGIVVGRWLAKFRPTNVFGRLGHRQVLGLFEDLKHTQDAQLILDRLLDELALPVELENRSVTLSACTGAVLDPAAYASAQDILEGAEQALDDARQAQGSQGCVGASLGWLPGEMGMASERKTGFPSISGIT